MLPGRLRRLQAASFLDIGDAASTRRRCLARPRHAATSFASGLHDTTATSFDMSKRFKWSDKYVEGEAKPGLYVKHAEIAHESPHNSHEHKDGHQSSPNQESTSSASSQGPLPIDKEQWSAEDRPIIFEDVDGVLNRYEIGAPTLESGLLANLARVVKNTNANLVISSQWRKWPDDHMVRLKDALAAAGIGPERIIGQTPVLCSAWQCRAREIGNFLRQHPQLGHAGWVAVDDVNLEAQDHSFMHGHFVKTDPMDGLTSEMADELETMLKSPAASLVRLPAEA